MKTVILIILLLLGVVGCGLRMTYPNLDWLIPWYVDDYISLNQEQRSLLEKRLMHALDWHCHTQLPVYAHMLKALANDLDDPGRPLSVERWHAYAEQLNRRWRDIKIQIGPEMAEILASASDKQIAELFENVERRNNAFKDQYVDIPLDQLEQKRRKKMIKRVDRWFSEITPVQKQAIDDWSAAIRPLAADGLDYRQRVTAELRNLLTRRTDDPDFKRRLCGPAGECRSTQIRGVSKEDRFQHGFNRRPVGEIRPVNNACPAVAPAQTHPYPGRRF
jgi:hypothetical protein